MDSIRRSILVTGAAATAMAVAPRVCAQQIGEGGTAMPAYEKGPVRIHYEEAGSGSPLLLIAGGIEQLMSMYSNALLAKTQFRGAGANPN